ncbi:phosphate signaling complex protein PhoU [Gulosibacter macacae]|uniref:Phosphate-specific transport system accessory protein PhoU n=1 Tax=Gulosibacter macacae TaxID=2488791 RepID=A0A3P3VXI5_9MICO|nr:phosphate signaling complex protein PhoU [Gulosibacter macacae]RRJ87501.1 phosphate signaling complex protein PhoU [Gulosibacter macacae]
MREVFQQELADVQNGLVEVSRGVLEAIRNATQAFQTSDVSLADKVIGNDINIDEQTARIDDLTVEILLLQAPVARDLRFVVTTMRIGSSLERMGDLAAHIAQLARLRFPEFVGPEGLREKFVRAGELACAQAEKIAALLDTEEEALIDDIISSDDAIDDLHKEVLDYLTAHTDDLSGQTAQIVDATLANRYFERFSDHAVSIARRMRYLQDGAPTAE